MLFINTLKSSHINPQVIKNYLAIYPEIPHPLLLVPQILYYIYIMF